MTTLLGFRLPLGMLVIFTITIGSAMCKEDPTFCDVCYCFSTEDNNTKATCKPDKLDFDRPLEFSKTPDNVTELDISFGFETVELVDDFFSSLPRLRELYFYLQKVDRIAPMAFRGLSSLEVLLLYSNSLGVFPVIPLQQVASTMVELNVTQQDCIQSLPADSFQGFLRLRSLDLSWIHLRQVDGSAFRGLKALRTLVLNGNSLTTLDPRTFTELHALEYLDLRTNYFTSVPEAAITGLHLLATFRFSFNPTPFRFYDFRFLRQMPIIHTLDFVNCSIRAVSEAALANFKSAPKLENLYLSKNLFRCTTDLCPFVRFYTSSASGISFWPVGESLPPPYECHMPNELRGYSLDELESTLCALSSSSASSLSENATSSTAIANGISSSSSAATSSSNAPRKVFASLSATSLLTILALIVVGPEV